MEEKMEKIFDLMADMTLDMLGEFKREKVVLNEANIQMIRTTQSLYETISYAKQPVITTATSIQDFKEK